MKQLATAALAAVLTLSFSVSAVVAEHTVKLEVSAGEHDRTNVPVRTLIEVPAELAEVTVAEVKRAGGAATTGQLSAPRLLAQEQAAPQGRAVRELTFLVDTLGRGETAVYTATIRSGATAEGTTYAWRDTPGKSTELRYGERPVLRYMYEALDESSAAARERTYKPFHHLFSPAGETLLSKGPGGLFPHHRGIYYGFMKCKYGSGKTADTWHCRNGAYQSHDGFLSQAVGPVLGRHRVEIGWHGKDKNTFASEQRELTAYNVPGGTLVEFASRLENVSDGKLILDGDPQHAGFQFRASNEVAEKTKGQTYYVRPDGKGKAGQTRNWPQDKAHADLPWNAMSFVVGGQRYTIAYLDRPSNPKEARFSERDYGRFGSYFVQEIPQGESLDVNYRLWVQAGEMEPEQVAAHHANFVDPPTVKVLSK